MIMVGMLTWFIVNPSPALTTTRVLFYNLTVNYAQILTFLSNSIVLLLVILALGATLYNIYWKLNDRRIRQLMIQNGKKWDREQGFDPNLSGEFEAAKGGYDIERNLQGPLMASGYLDWMEQALNADPGDTERQAEEQS